jgi:hypothetical protein
MREFGDEKQITAIPYGISIQSLFAANSGFQRPLRGRKPTR